MTGVVSLHGVIHAIGQKFSGELAERNALAAKIAHEAVRREVEGLTHA
jgi:hypothetical protein